MDGHPAARRGGPAGGYFLVQVSPAGAVGSAYASDHMANPTVLMNASVGKIALVATTAGLPAVACPVSYTHDFVGYGGTACFEGGGPTIAPSNVSSVIRTGGGCPDGNNMANFVSNSPPSPRSSVSATTPVVCDCAANETNAVSELDFCNLQFPSTITASAASTVATDVFGRVFEAGVTEVAGADPSITAQIGIGPTGVDPATLAGWSWGAASFNVQVGNDDEYQRALATPNVPGAYSYTSRFTEDGVNWTYCDLDGAGSNAGLTFDPLLLGVMTITP